MPSSSFRLDLLQVDLLASERAFFGREAADRERRIRERSSRAIWNPTKDFFESLASGIQMSRDFNIRSIWKVRKSRSVKRPKRDKRCISCLLRKEKTHAWTGNQHKAVVGRTQCYPSLNRTISMWAGSQMLSVLGRKLCIWSIWNRSSESFCSIREKNLF